MTRGLQEASNVREDADRKRKVDSPGTEINKLREQNQSTEPVRLGKEDLQNDGELIWGFARYQVVLAVLKAVCRVGRQIGRAIEDELFWWNLDREGKNGYPSCRAPSHGISTGNPIVHAPEVGRLVSMAA